MASYINYRFRGKFDKLTLQEMFNTDVVSVDQNTVVVEKFDDIKELYEAVKNSNVEDFSWIEGDEALNFFDYVPSDDEIKSFVNYDLSDSNQAKIIEIARSHGIEFETIDDIIDQDNENDISEEITRRLRWAVVSGTESGYLSDAYEYLKNKLDDATENGFYVNVAQLQLCIGIDNLKKLYTEYEDAFEGGEGLSAYYDFVFRHKHDYSDFDEESANQHLEDSLSEIK